MLEPADVSLGLRYLPGYDVIVVTDDVAAEAIPVAAEAAEFAGAHLVVLVGEGSAAPEGLLPRRSCSRHPLTILTVPSRPWSAAMRPALAAGESPADAFAAARGASWSVLSPEEHQT